MRARIKPHMGPQVEGERYSEDCFGQLRIACSKISSECNTETSMERVNKDGHLIGHYVEHSFYSDYAWKKISSK